MNKLGLFVFCVFLIPAFNNALAQSRSWYQKAHVGGDARHRCTAFAIGNKGYYGGGHINSGTSVIYSDYWEYDPGTNSWTQIANYGGGLRYHSSAFVINNEGYVGCGEATDNAYTNDFWKYVPEVNEWFPVADLPAVPRRGGTAFTINGIGYFGSGQSDEGYHSDFYAYDPETNSWSSIASLPGIERSASVSFVHEGKAYIGTGHMVGAALSDFYEYDPSIDTWTAKATVGGSVRQDAMAFMIDDKGYIGTGNDNIDEDFNDIWEYDFEADTWTQIGDFSGAKRRYAVTFVIDNIPYIVGGTDGTNFKDLWAWAPSVSLTELYLNKVEVAAYPNPSSEIITIKLGNTVNMDQIAYCITDINGKIVQGIRSLPNETVLYKSDYGAGIYFFNIVFENKIYQTKKIVFTP